MGLFDSLFGKDEALPSQVTFTLDQAGHTYEDGSVGLLPTSLTITPDDRRVAVIGLNGAGKTTLLKLLDGAFAATSGSVSITAGETALSPAVKRDLKRIEDIKGEQQQIGWGSQIRSYVFMPYTLVKDHRTNCESGNINAVMDGDLDPFINAYLKAASQGEI